MSGKTSNIISIPPELEHMTFEERVQFGAESAVRCMGVTAQDRVFIITDYERESIARRVAIAALARHADVSVHFLEHYGERPLTTFSQELRNDILQARPTVTYYIATAKPGEIAFRIPLLPFLAQELKVRHGHMIGIGSPVMDAITSKENGATCPKAKSTQHPPPLTASSSATYWVTTSHTSTAYWNTPSSSP